MTREIQDVLWLTASDSGGGKRSVTLHPLFLILTFSKHNFKLCESLKENPYIHFILVNATLEGT